MNWRRRSDRGLLWVMVCVSAACGGGSITSATGAATTVGPTTTLAATTLATITTAATATTPATRVDPPTRPVCEQIATGIANRHPGRTQLVIVHAAAWTDTTATLQVARFTEAGWLCDRALDARIGEAGFRPLLERRSGDDTTPAGIFPLGVMTAWDGQQFSFFGNAPDPGVGGGAYRRVRTGDCFGATPNTAGYGHLRYDTTCPGPDDEYLPRFVSAYTNAALIGANMEPNVSGDAPGETPYAAAIFLHRNVYTLAGATSGATKPTSGCVSLAQGDLSSTLLALRSDVLFVMGPRSWLLDRA